MQDYRIIFPNDNEGISVVIPAPGIDQKDVLKAVPSGKPYLIVGSNDIPTDRTFRDAWQADFSNAQVKE